MPCTGNLKSERERKQKTAIVKRGTHSEETAALKWDGEKEQKIAHSVIEVSSEVSKEKKITSLASEYQSVAAETNWLPANWNEERCAKKKMLTK